MGTLHSGFIIIESNAIFRLFYILRCFIINLISIIRFYIFVIRMKKMKEEFTNRSISPCIQVIFYIYFLYKKNAYFNKTNLYNDIKVDKSCL